MREAFRIYCVALILWHCLDLTSYSDTELEREPGERENDRDRMMKKKDGYIERGLTPDS